MSKVYRIDDAAPVVQEEKSRVPLVAGISAGVVVIATAGFFFATRKPAGPKNARVAAPPKQVAKGEPPALRPVSAQPPPGFVTPDWRAGLPPERRLPPPASATPGSVQPGAQPGQQPVNQQQQFGTQPGVGTGQGWGARPGTPGFGGGPGNAAPAAPGVGFGQPAAPAGQGPAATVVIARVKASVVLILAVTYDGVSSGTGFAIGPNQVGTCAHVVEGAREILVVTADGRQFGARVGAADANNDVAVLTCNGALPPALQLGDSSRVAEGEELAITGYPVVGKLLALGYAPTSSTSRGTVSAKRMRSTPYGPVEEIQTDAAINSGNSGGPVYLLRDGSVIGLAASKMTREQNIGFASSINALRRIAGR